MSLKRVGVGILGCRNSGLSENKFQWSEYWAVGILGTPRKVVPRNSGSEYMHVYKQYVRIKQGCGTSLYTA